MDLDEGIKTTCLIDPVGGSLAGVEFRDAGRKQLKGIKGRQRVFEVVW